MLPSITESIGKVEEQACIKKYRNVYNTPAIFTCEKQKFLELIQSIKSAKKTSYNHFSVLSKICVEKFILPLTTESIGKVEEQACIKKCRNVV